MVKTERGLKVLLLLLLLQSRRGMRRVRHGHATEMPVSVMLLLLGHVMQRRQRCHRLKGNVGQLLLVLQALLLLLLLLLLLQK